MSYGDVCPRCRMYTSTSNPMWRCRCAPANAQDRRGLAIAHAVWPGFDELPDTTARLVKVDEVLAGLPVPTLSQKDREAIEAAAARIPEEP